jgi:tetratricopeptide (TPR) repeat protein
MVRKHWELIVLVICAGAILYGLVPLRTALQEKPEVAPGDGQEKFARQLELGWRYEAERSWDQARAAYVEAALAEQVEIAIQGRNGLQRIFEFENGLLNRAQVFLRSLLPLWILILVALGLRRLYKSRITRPGYLIAPFEDFTEKNQAAGFNALLNFHLQEARSVLLRGQQQLLGFATPEFPLFTTTLGEAHDSLAEALASLETLQVGGFDLPFGKLLLILRQWAATREYVISGALHKPGDKIRLYAEIRESKTNLIAQHWELVGDEGADALSGLACELAYRLLFYIGQTAPVMEQQGLEASNLHSQQYFIQGLQLLQQDAIPGKSAHLARAAELFQEVTVIDPGYISAQYALGLTYTKMGQVKVAARHFQEVIDNGGPLEMEATYNMGLCFYHEFKPWAYDKAKGCFQRVLDQAPSEEKMLRALALTGFANIMAQLVGEDQYMTQRGVDAALGDVEGYCQQARELVRGQQLDPQTRFVQALIRNALGIAHYYAGKIYPARKHLREAIQVYPENSVAYGYLALTYLEDNQTGLAHDWFDRTLEWNPAPQVVEYLNYKFGRYYHGQGDWNLAIEYYGEAPSFAFARNYLGEVFVEAEEYENAVEMFRSAIQLNSKEVRFWLNLAWTIPLLDDPELLPEALGAARRAVEFPGDDWERRDVLGWVYYCLGDWQKAEQAFHRSIGIEPRVRNHYHLALTFQKLENLPRALTAIEDGFATADISPEWRRKAADLREEIIPLIGEDEEGA